MAGVDGSVGRGSRSRAAGQGRCCESLGSVADAGESGKDMTIGHFDATASISGMPARQIERCAKGAGDNEEHYARSLDLRAVFAVCLLATSHADLDHGRRRLRPQLRRQMKNSRNSSRCLMIPTSARGWKPWQSRRRKPGGVDCRSRSPSWKAPSSRPPVGAAQCAFPRVPGEAAKAASIVRTDINTGGPRPAYRHSRALLHWAWICGGMAVPARDS